MCLPELWPENEEAYLVYADVSGQFIMGPDGAIALNHEAIYRSMDRIGIEQKQFVFERVNAVFRLVKEAYQKDKRHG